MTNPGFGQRGSFAQNDVCLNVQTMYIYIILNFTSLYDVRFYFGEGLRLELLKSLVIEFQQVVKILKIVENQWRD